MMYIYCIYPSSTYDEQDDSDEHDDDSERVAAVTTLVPGKGEVRTCKTKKWNNQCDGFDVVFIEVDPDNGNHIHVRFGQVTKSASSHNSLNSSTSLPFSNSLKTRDTK